MRDIANNFCYCGFIILKMVDFLIDNNIFWNSQYAPDCTILIKKNRMCQIVIVSTEKIMPDCTILIKENLGEHAPRPP